MALTAMKACTAQAEFGDALLFTRAGHGLQDVPPQIRVIEVTTIASVEDYSRFMLKELGAFLRTSHMLIVQWDGYVIDPRMWTPAFLDVDYIGAVWPQFKDRHRVGNGGFSLRSKKLIAALAQDEFTPSHPEDTCIARTYREQLERQHGIRFADEAMARQFAFERERSTPSSFGFHGLSNFPLVMPTAQVATFVEQAPPELFAGLETRGFIKHLIAKGERKIARQAMRKRMKNKRMDWSDMRLWLRLYLA